MRSLIPLLLLASACVTPHVGREVRSTWSTLVLSCAGYYCLLENRGDASLNVRVKSVTLEPGGGRARLAMDGIERLPPAARVKGELVVEDQLAANVKPTCARVCLDGPAVECVGVPLSVTSQACTH